MSQEPLLQLTGLYRVRRVLSDRVPEGAAFWTPVLRYWPLVSALAWRQISARYRGSVFGLLWAVLTPLLMLAVYTFVFSVIFERRWDTVLGDKANFAMFLLAGLVCHQFVAECLTRSSTLIVENKVFVKKMIFPLEVLPPVLVLSALFNVGITAGVLLVMYLVWFGLPPLTILLTPLAFVPLVMCGLGIGWLVAALGAYLRDLRHVSTIFATLLLFLTPIFYPIEAVPDPYATIILLNPLAGIVSAMRDLMFFGVLPDFWLVAGLWLGTGTFAAISSVFFMRLRMTFADVV